MPSVLYQVSLSCVFVRMFACSHSSAWFKSEMGKMCRYIRPFIFLLLLERATYLLCVRTRANDEIIDKGEREKGKGGTETEHALSPLSPFPLSPLPACLPSPDAYFTCLLALLAYPSATYIAFPICSAAHPTRRGVFPAEGARAKPYPHPVI